MFSIFVWMRKSFYTISSIIKLKYSTKIRLLKKYRIVHYFIKIYYRAFPKMTLVTLISSTRWHFTLVRGFLKISRGHCLTVLIYIALVHPLFNNVLYPDIQTFGCEGVIISRCNLLYYYINKLYFYYFYLYFIWLWILQSNCYTRGNFFEFT